MFMPWEIDWSDPQAAQSAVRPRVQGPARQPPPRHPDEVARDEAAERRAAAAEARAAESHRLQMQPNPALTEGGRMARGFYERALRANEGYGQGVSPRGPVGQTLIDILPENLERSLGSSERRTADTFADEFIAATLRRESGAAIPPEEREAQYRRYFPVPGDTEEQIRVKEQLRRNALDALHVQAFGDFPQQQPQGEQGAAPALGQMTRVDQRAVAPGPGGQMQLSDDTRTSINPALAGLNAAVSQMLERREPIGRVAKYLRDRGIPAPEVQRMIPRLNEIRQFQRRNPNYRGPYTVNLEAEEARLDPIASTIADFADSPFGAGAVAAGDITTGGHLDNLVGLTGGDAELANLGIQELRGRYPGSSLAGDVAGGASLFGGGRALLSGGAQLLGRSAPGIATGTFAPGAIAGDVAMGGYIGSGQDGTDPFSAQGAALGAAFGTGGGVAGRGLINSAARAISPTGGRMAPLYAEGVQPTLGQRIGGAADRFEQAITSVPFVGGIPRRARNQAIDQFQRGAINQALRDIGQELPANIPVGTKAQAHLQRAFNKEFDQIRSQMRFVPDQQFGVEFGAIQQEVALLRADSQRAFEQLVRKDLGTRLRVRGGTLAGNDYVRVASRLSAQARAIRKNPSGDHQLADAYERLADALDSGAARNSAPQVAQRLQSARQGYQKAVVIEDAARRRGTGGGEFSPKQFDAAVQNVGGGLRSRSYLRGEAPMQDYAEAGLDLGDTLANSGSVDRILASGAIGTAGWTNPWLLSPLAAGLAANAPGVRQGINAMIAPNRRGLFGLRRQVQDRAYLGGPLLGAPLAIEAQ